MAYMYRANVPTYTTLRGSPLYFFYDCEATCNKLLEDRVIEVAVMLYTKNLEPHLSTDKIIELTRPSGHYTSLCSCEREINPQVVPIIHLTSADLLGQPPLTTVLNELFDWISEKLAKAQTLTRRTYTPVLVSHGGHGFDFPMLLIELERIGQRSLTRKFEALNLHFADTYLMCKKLKDEGHYILRNVESLGVQGLYTTFFPREPYNAHRALPDAKALCKIFTESLLEGTVGHNLRDTVRSVTFIREIVELLKAGFFNIRKVQDMVERGINLAVLQAKRRSMTKFEFRAYLRSSFSIMRPQGQLERIFNLV